MKKLYFILSLALLNSIAHAAVEPAFQQMKSVYEKAFHLSSSTYRASCSYPKLSQPRLEALFRNKVSKLREVSLWAPLIGIPGQHFKLHKSSAALSSQNASVGDHIEIRLPADPTRRSYWVRVESTKLSDIGPSDKSFTLILRPAKSPQAPGHSNSIDHFFTDAATNTLKISLTGSELKATVVGRNEEPNINFAPSIQDAFSNSVIVHMGWGVRLPKIGQIGFQGLIWKRLTQNLINCPK